MSAGFARRLGQRKRTAQGGEAIAKRCRLTDPVKFSLHRVSNRRLLGTNPEGCEGGDKGRSLVIVDVERHRLFGYPSRSA